MTPAQASNLITKVRQAGTSLINALNEFRAAQSEYAGFEALTTLADE